MNANEHVRNIPLDIILALLTCGLWNLLVQAKQMEAVNDMIDQDKYNFLNWLVFTLITCGLYHIYHEYRMSEDLAQAAGRSGSNDSMISVVLCFVGLSLVVDAIQQSVINAHYGDSSL